MNGGLMLTMTTQTARPKFNLGLPTWIILKTKGQPTADTQAALAKLADDYGWGLQSWADMSAILDKMLNGLVAALWALIVAVLLSAGWGS